MGTNTKIHWCNHTFSPWVGCTKVSPGCENCYAENMARRFFKDAKWGNHPRVRTSEANWKLPIKWNREAEKRFGPTRKKLEESKNVEERISAFNEITNISNPRVFCGSMCDVFDDSVPAEWRLDLFSLIFATPYLRWLLLTKRIGNAQRMIQEVAENLIDPRTKKPIRECVLMHNVWLGITVCNQEEADRDIPKLLEITAKKRFLSIEPMLGEISFRWAKFVNSKEMHRSFGRENHLDGLRGIDWVICGGETGAKARPMNPGWVRSIRDQCDEASVPFLFKQWGEFRQAKDRDELLNMGKTPVFFFEDGERAVFRLGKKSAGRLLDGREWNEVP